MGNFDPSVFLGAQGGSHAIAYAAGCVSTWFFTNKILVNPLRKRLDKLENKFLGLDHD